MALIRPPTGISEGLNKRCWTFYYQYITLSSRAEDRQQMYSWGLLVGKVSLIDPEISPIPPLIFTEGVNMCEMCPLVFISDITRLWAARVWKCSEISETNSVSIDDRPNVFLKFSEVRSTHPWELFGENAPLQKIGRWKCAKSPITQPRIIRFRSNFVLSLNT